MHNVGQPEAERQELQCRRLEFEEERQQLLWEQQQLLQECECLMQEIQDDVDARIAELERERQPFQVRAIKGHVLEREQQQDSNKPSWRKRIQIRFLRPWWNQVLNLLDLASNNKRYGLVCMAGESSAVSVKNLVRRGTHTKDI